MSRRLFQLVAGIVILWAAITPLLECFDRWDKDPVPIHDTEIHLTAGFVGLGIVLTLAKLLRYVPKLITASRQSDPMILIWQGLQGVEKNSQEPTASPPITPLRI